MIRASRGIHLCYSRGQDIGLQRYWVTGPTGRLAFPGFVSTIQAACWPGEGFGEGACYVKLPVLVLFTVPVQAEWTDENEKFRMKLVAPRTRPCKQSPKTI